MPPGSDSDQSSYYIREADLHKFDNLFLNPIEHCKYIYLNNCVLRIRSQNKYVCR